MAFTCTAGRYCTAGPVEQHSCIGFHLHFRSVRTAGPVEQHSCIGFYMHSGRFRVAGPVEQHSCIGFHLHSKKNSEPMVCR
jgi:hypothetical protein